MLYKGVGTNDGPFTNTDFWSSDSTAFDKLMVL